MRLSRSGNIQRLRFGSLSSGCSERSEQLCTRVRRGKLVYVDADHGHPNVCVPSCNYACQPFSVRLGLQDSFLTSTRIAGMQSHNACVVQQARPPFKLNPSTNPDRPGQRTNYIMLVDRGPRKL